MTANLPQTPSKTIKNHQKPSKTSKPSLLTLWGGQNPISYELIAKKCLRFGLLFVDLAVSPGVPRENDQKVAKNRKTPLFN
jgi:hypothetical protein